MKNLLVVSLVMFGFATAGNAAHWRDQAVKAADLLAEKIEALDETMHKAYKHHHTTAFKKAIEDVHHIEHLIEDLVDDLPAAPFNELCEDFHHLYSDLVEIRLGLIALHIQHHRDILVAWNNMAHVYNHHLNPFFKNCHHHGEWTAGTVVTALELL